MPELVLCVAVGVIIATAIQAIRNPTKRLVFNGHQLDISYGPTERVRYDGKLMSEKASVFGATHVFRVDEANEEVEYDVEIRMGFWGAKVTVRRNGAVLYAD